jgi:hypothetical protein
MDLIKLSIYYKNLCMTYFLYNRCTKKNINNSVNSANNVVSSEIIER